MLKEGGRDGVDRRPPGHRVELRHLSAGSPSPPGVLELRAVIGRLFLFHFGGGSDYVSGEIRAVSRDEIDYGGLHSWAGQSKAKPRICRRASSYLAKCQPVSRRTLISPNLSPTVTRRRNQWLDPALSIFLSFGFIFLFGFIFNVCPDGLLPAPPSNRHFHG
jgi:hypothetical protein